MSDAARADHAFVNHATRRLVSAQETERRRLARELHDRAGQMLTVLRWSLERAQNSLPDDHAAATELQRAIQFTSTLARDLDFLTWTLQPPMLEELGLEAVLPRFVAEWSAHAGIAAEFSSTDVERLAPHAETTFYRVAQEALNNVARHAHATRVDVVLSASNGVVQLVVKDDGVGFDPSQEPSTGFGLTGMYERAALAGATLHIDSANREGTSVTLRYRPPPAHAADTGAEL
jgi:two-component system sensor histidine kinase UhpB